ncbi:uracil-DNA glycosylase [Pelomyxa schiedti]|nr:uracil-DNA glycosylase [Pelomyxa schiedti]
MKNVSIVTPDFFTGSKTEKTGQLAPQSDKDPVIPHLNHSSVSLNSTDEPKTVSTPCEEIDPIVGKEVTEIPLEDTLLNEIDKIERNQVEVKPNQQEPKSSGSGPPNYRKPAYSGLTRVYNFEDPGQPSFPEEYTILNRKVLHCTDLSNNENKYYCLELHYGGYSNYRVFTHWGKTDEIDWRRSSSCGQKQCRYVHTEVQAQTLFQIILDEKLSEYKQYKIVDLNVSTIGSDKGIESGNAKAPTVPTESHTPSSSINLTPSVAHLVSLLFSEATQSLISQLNVLITARGIETPLGVLTSNQVAKGRSILDKIQSILLMAGPPGDIKKLSGEFYSLIPHKIGQSKSQISSALINNLSLLHQKQELLQLMDDVLRVLSTGEASESALLTSKYRALHCTITEVEEGTPEYQRLLECIREEDRDTFTSTIFNTKLLFHGSKAGNWLGILSRGFLDPKTVLSMGVSRTDEGLLGTGLYFTPDPLTAIKYTTGSNRIIAAATVALGNIKDYYTHMPTLVSPPQNYHSCHGVKSQPELHSEFSDDEYVIYDKTQQKLEYLVEFTLENDSTMVTEESIIADKPTQNLQTLESEKPALRPSNPTSQSPSPPKSLSQPPLAEPILKAPRTVARVPTVQEPTTSVRKTLPHSSQAPLHSNFLPVATSNAPQASSKPKSPHPITVEFLTTALPRYASWVATLRVDYKSELMTWEKAGKSGQFFYVDLSDWKQRSIRATGFADVAHKLFPFFEEGKVYSISHCIIQPSRETYGVIHNPNQLLFTAETSVDLSTDHNPFPPVLAHYLPLTTALKRGHQAVVDVVGCVSSIGELNSITAASTGNAIPTRQVQLRDKSGSAVLQVWYATATECPFSVNSIIALRGVLVNDFQDVKTLSTKHASFHLYIDKTDIPEVADLKKWMEKQVSQESLVLKVPPSQSTIEQDIPSLQIPEVNSVVQRWMVPSGKLEVPSIQPDSISKSLCGEHLSWDSVQVCQWLEDTLNLPQYSPLFKQQQITGAILETLSDSDLLNYLGVSSLGHRKVIISAVETLRQKTRDTRAHLIETIVKDHETITEFARELRLRVQKDAAVDWAGFSSFLSNMCSPALAQIVLSHLSPPILKRLQEFGLRNNLITNAVINLSLNNNEAVLKDSLASQSKEVEVPNRLLLNPFSHLDDLCARKLDSSEELGLELISASQLPQDTLDHCFRWKIGHSPIVSLKVFKANFSLFTRNLLRDIDWRNIALCGGSVLASLLLAPKTIPLEDWYFGEHSLWKNSDIDLFLIGLTSELALEKIKSLYASLKKASGVEPCIILTKNALTLAFGWPYRHIQIILHLYKSIEDVLCSFDLDCVCFAFDGLQVTCMPRALRALNTRTNFVDVNLFKHFHYGRHIRAVKYWKRGFNLRLLAPTFSLLCPAPELYIDIPVLAGALSIQYKAQRVTEYDSAYIPVGPSYSATAISEHLKRKSDKMVTGLLKSGKLASAKLFRPFFVVGALDELLQHNLFQSSDLGTSGKTIQSPPQTSTILSVSCSIPQGVTIPPVLLPSTKPSSSHSIVAKIPASPNTTVLMLKSFLKEPSWRELLGEQFILPYFTQIEAKIWDFLAEGKRIYPPLPSVFRAFNCTPFSQVKVILLGQDPYHGEGQADGLSFSVPPSITTPPSLKNIFLELRSDIPGFKMPTCGCLDSWAKQGVLLLNTTLTVEAGKPNSHKDIGWAKFTTAALQMLAKGGKPLVFILLGKFAQEYCSEVTLGANTLVLKAAHPSPFSAQKFFGCRVFSKANAFLLSHHQSPINWNL